VATPAIEIKNLWFKYSLASEWTLKNLNLSVGEGEFVVIMGPSGCGKSTLLYILTGIIPNMIKGEMRGSVHILGRDILKLPPSESVKNVGFVFQNPESQIIMPSVYEEVVFGLENMGLPAEETTRRAREVLDYVGLWDKRDSSPWSLSAGERQVLAIASVLALKPRVLILDEPTSMLDHKDTARVLNLVSKLKEELRMTIVVVEHRIEWAVEVADRVAIMDNGEFVTEGRPEEVFSRMDLVKRCGVRPPMVTEVFYHLVERGYKVGRIPVTARQALDFLSKLLRRGVSSTE
jgi:energy-coupling factor transport system ATP-binding protein